MTQHDKTDSRFINPWLTRKELAQRLHVSAGSLATWAMYKKGPRYRKVGKNALYHIDDVIAYENSLPNALEESAA